MTSRILRQCTNGRHRWRRLALWGCTALTCAGPLVSSLGGAVSTWTGAAGSWSNSANWTPTNVPGDQIGIPEDAKIASGTPTLDATFTVQNLTLNGGELRANPGNVLNVNGQLSWSGATIGSSATVSSSGSYSLSGTLTNLGTLNLGIGSVDVSTSLNNSGTITASSGLFNLRLGTNSGWLQANSGATILFQGVGSYVLAPGTVLAGDGTYSINSAVVLQTSTTVKNVVLSGTLIGGTLTTSADLVWNSGDMKGGGQTNIDSTGTLYLATTGTKNLESRQLLNNGTIDWTGDSTLYVHSGSSIQNEGLLKISANAVMSAAPFTTAGQLTSDVTLQKLGTLTTASLDVPVINNGSVNVSQGTLVIGGGGTGSGGSTWNISPGATLVFSSGGASPYVLNSGAAITNLGALINAGYLKAPADVLSGKDLVMDSLYASELFIVGDLDASQLNWNRGVLSGPGITTMAGHTFAAPWGVAGGRTLENTGNLTWTNGASWGLGYADVMSAFDNVTPGTISNFSGASFNFNSDATVGLPVAPELLIINNSGSLNVSDTKTVDIHGSMSNSGTVNVGSGSTLRLHNGGTNSGVYTIGDDGALLFQGSQTHSFLGSSRIDGVGTTTSVHQLLFDAATTNFSGSVGTLVSVQSGADENSGAVLNLQSGASLHPVSFTVAGGTANVMGGASLLTPNLTFRSGMMVVNGGATVSANSTTLGQDGLPSAYLRIEPGVTFSAGSLTQKSNSTLHLNNGTVAATGVVDAQGFIIGSGTIDAPSVALSHGAALSPGVDTGQIGFLTMTGALTLDGSSAVGIDVNAETHQSDRIDAGGAMELGAAFLFVTLVGSPASILPSDSFVIASAASRLGQFTIDLPDLVFAYDVNGGQVGEFQVQYTPTQVVLLNFIPEPHSAMVWVGISLLSLRPGRSRERTA